MCPHRTRWFLLGLLGGLQGLFGVACDSRLPTPSLSATSHAEQRSVSSLLLPEAQTQDQLRVALSAQFVYEAARLRRRFEQPFARPPELREQACPDAELQRFQAPELTLGLEARDSRAQSKELIPFKILESLRVDPLRRAEAEALEATAQGDGLRLVRTLEGGTQGLAMLRSLSSRRFLGVFHVLHYKQPIFAYNARKNRRVWTPGHIIAWLVIHDLDQGNALCQTALRAKNHVHLGTQAAHARELTRTKLEVELADTLRTEAQGALERITRELTLPQGFAFKKET